MSNEENIRAGRITKAMTFNEKVLAMTSRVPKGQITTYRAIAEALGTRAYRAVGQALHRNPYAPGVPCHRVVGADGKLTGFAGGLSKKRLMLEAEGVAVERDRVDVSGHFCLSK